MLKKGIILVVMLLFIGMSAVPSINGTINKSMDMRIINNIEQSQLHVSFTRPENGIYCFDKKILPFPVPLILCGNITVEAEIEPMSEVDRIEIYINDGLHEVIVGGGPYYEFDYIWGGPPFSKIMFGIIAYAINGTQAYGEITIWRIFR